MDKTSFVYNKSFMIQLTLCSVCNNYHNIAEAHKCSNIKQPQIDIMQTIADNLVKVKPPKRKKK